MGVSVDVSLFYNKRFRRSKPGSDWSGSYTASFDPDFSIIAVRHGERGPAHWLHFDAKYRVERKQMEQLFDVGDELPSEADRQQSDAYSSSSYEEELARVHKQEDLYKMHTYRDGILSTRGAYVLFPGDGVGGRLEGPSPTLFVRHPSATSSADNHRIPSVGAFDLTPNGDPEQRTAIANFFGSVFESAATGSSYVEEDEFFKP